MLSNHKEPVPVGLPRWLEAALAAIGLLLALPLFLAIAVAIRLTSPGPVLFSQQRVGKDGRLFTMRKFRSMHTASDGSRVTARGDERVTRVGRWLRLSKVDELPELWNILVGDMSIVGPRPEVPEYVDLGNPLWRLVLAVRPGLTDPATVYLRNEEAILAAIDGDRETFYRQTLLPYKLLISSDYVRIRSWWSDLVVIARTALKIFRPEATSPSFAFIEQGLAALRARYADSRSSSGYEGSESCTKK